MGRVSGRVRWVGLLARVLPRYTADGLGFERRRLDLIDGVCCWLHLSAG